MYLDSNRLHLSLNGNLVLELIGNPKTKHGERSVLNAYKWKEHEIQDAEVAGLHVSWCGTLGRWV